jgi:hypothetical protein
MLAVTGIASGAAMTWLFRRVADGPAIRAAMDRIQAHLLEFWLFADEPRAIWKSWQGLLAANARLLGRLLAPCLVLSIPAVPLFFFLDAVYGTAPLPVGKPALVTVEFEQAIPDTVELRASDGFAIETDAVRIPAERQVSWRIRPLRPTTGELECIVPGTRLSKSVTAGEGFPYHSPRRSQSFVELARYPTESPLPRGPVAWIEISYPSRTGLHWSVWFLASSLIGALCAVQYYGFQSRRS